MDTTTLSIHLSPAALRVFREGYLAATFAAESSPLADADFLARIDAAIAALEARQGSCSVNLDAEVVR